MAVTTSNLNLLKTKMPTVEQIAQITEGQLDDLEHYILRPKAKEPQYDLIEMVILATNKTLMNIYKYRNDKPTVVNLISGLTVTPDEELQLLTIVDATTSNMYTRKAYRFSPEKQEDGYFKIVGKPVEVSKELLDESRKIKRSEVKKRLLEDLEFSINTF